MASRGLIGFLGADGDCTSSFCRTDNYSAAGNGPKLLAYYPERSDAERLANNGWMSCLHYPFAALEAANARVAEERKGAAALCEQDGLPHAHPVTLEWNLMRERFEESIWIESMCIWVDGYRGMHGWHYIDGECFDELIPLVDAIRLEPERQRGLELVNEFENEVIHSDDYQRALRTDTDDRAVRRRTVDFCSMVDAADITEFTRKCARTRWLGNIHHRDASAARRRKLAADKAYDAA